MSARLRPRSSHILRLERREGAGLGGAQIRRRFVVRLGGPACQAPVLKDVVTVGDQHGTVRAQRGRVREGKVSVREA